MATLCLGMPTRAQEETAAKGQKSPADVAADSFFKVLGDRRAALDEARFDKIIKSGVAFVIESPTHARVPAVVTGLTTFHMTMTDPKLAPYRAAYLGRLNAAIFELRYKPDLPAETKTAVAALDAAASDSETREKFNRDTLRTLREKIDTLTRQPGSGRFLVERERSYVEILTKGLNPAAGEAQLRKLASHPDKDVAAMAQEELNLAEVRKAPYEMKFTALDGKECDVAKMRGKVVAVLFLSAKDEASLKALTTIKGVHTQYKKQGFETVAISYDKEADREAVAKFVKDNKVPWPVHFDGKGSENAFGSKLNVRRTPTVALFDQKGILLTHSIRPDRLEGEVKKLLGVKDEVAEMPDAGGSSSRRRR